MFLSGQKRYFHFYSKDMKLWEWQMQKNDIIAVDRARCGGAEINKRQVNVKQKYTMERKAAL